MRNTLIGGVTVALLLSQAPVALAIPIISIDVDPSTPGIQTTRSVDNGTSFMIDVILTGDGSSLDTVIFETVFNDAGTVLRPAGVDGSPAAGTLAALGFGAIDAYAGVVLTPGAPMSSGTRFAPAAGFAGHSGGVGLLLLGGPPVSGDYSIFSLTFDALAPGVSRLLPSVGIGLPNEGGLAFFGTPVPFATAGATVNVNDTGVVIPEPSTLALFGLGLLAMWRIAGRRRRVS